MKNTRTRRHLFLGKNLIMMFVLLVVIVLSVWSWFASQGSVTASGLTVSIKSNDDVQIALPYRGSYPEDIKYNESGSDYLSGSSTEELYNAGHRFKEEINFNLSDAADQSTGLMNLISDVTSGGKDFIIPTFNPAQIETGKTVNDEGKYTIASAANKLRTDGDANNDEDYDYISLDFYIRSPQKDINIKASSVLKSKSEDSTPPKPLTGSSSIDENRVSGANDYFSADALVGAIRISIDTARVKSHSFDSVSGVYSDTYLTKNASTDSDTTMEQSNASNLKFLWLPRPDVFLKTTGSYITWRLFTGINPADTSSSTVTYSGDGTSIDSGLTMHQMAVKSFRHTFYEPNPATASAGKGLIKKVYYDSAMQGYYQLSNQQMADFQSDGAQSPPFFHVSKVNLSNPTACPTLGEDKQLMNDGLSTIPMANKNGITQSFDQHTPYSSVDKTEYYMYKCTLNIWIEGEDAEARRVMNKGTFNLYLEFE